jgi:HAD superfamily hydrolase (TIGR01450 family)
MSTFIFDLDGTLYLEDALLPGAYDTVKTLREAGHHVLFASNNTSLTHAAIVQTLEGAGIAVEPDGLATASHGTVAYLMAQPQLRSALVLGPLALREELAAAGLLVREDAAHPVDAVVVGRDDTFSYARLRMAQEAVFSGASLIATDGDRHVPHRDGLRPGTAVITAAVEAACFTSATVIGKPAPGLLRWLMARAAAAPATIVMVGDSIVTDIAAAAALGLYSVYVLSGIAQFHPEPLTYAPSLTLASVASLIPALEHARPDLLEV